MLKTSCINPIVMKTLSLCGHGDKILIASGNYPTESRSGDAQKVYLGVTSGLPTVVQVLRSLTGVVNFEKAEVMLPEGGAEPEIFAEIREALPSLELTPLGRYVFYDACCMPDVRLAISTGENRGYSSVLLTLNVSK